MFCIYVSLELNLNIRLQACITLIIYLQYVIKDIDQSTVYAHVISRLGSAFLIDSDVEPRQEFFRSQRIRQL